MDFAAIPGAFVFSLPAQFGWLGLLVVVGISVFAAARGREQRRGAGAHRLSVTALLLAALGFWSSLLALLAAARPLSWLAMAVLGLSLWRLPWGQAAVEQNPTGPRAAGPLPASDTGAMVLGLLGWALAVQLRPWGRGYLHGGFEEAVGEVVERVAPLRWELLFVVLALGVVVLAARSSRMALRSVGALALTGGALGLALDWGFGLGGGNEASAAALGAAALVLAPPLASGLSAWIWRPAPLLLVAVLCVLRLGVVDRWDCRRALEDPFTTFWVDGPDVTSIAVVPGNLPYVLALRQDGALLERLTARAVVSASTALEPAGGFLVSPSGTPSLPPSPTDLVVARVVDDEALRAEWWSVATLERLHSQSLDLPCRAGDALLETGSLRLWVPCTDRGALVLFDPEAAVEPSLLSRGRGIRHARVLAEGSLEDFMGAQARVAVRGADGKTLGTVALGPWAEGSSLAGPDLAIGRGPVGQLEIRGIERLRPDEARAPETESAEASDWLAALAEVRDRVRVGAWPSRPLWSHAQRSLYVPSPVEGKIWLVDPEVTWHRRAAHIGSPPRQVVVDGPSGTLYGVNRCGAFEVRIRSTFPWDDVGTSAPAQTAASGAGGL